MSFSVLFVSCQITLKRPCEGWLSLTGTPPWCCTTTLVPHTQREVALATDEMATNATGPSRISLLGLPPELRLRIYEEVFPHQICYVEHDEKEIIMTSAMGKLSGAMLRTCRLIYREAHPVLYSRTVFDMWVNLFRAPTIQRARSFIWRHMPGTAHRRLFIEPRLMKQVTFNVLEHNDPTPSRACIHAMIEALDGCAHVTRLQINFDGRPLMTGRVRNGRNGVLPKLITALQTLRCRGAINVTIASHSDEVNEILGFLVEQPNA
jgi:hypothetical protein